MWWAASFDDTMLKSAGVRRTGACSEARSTALFPFTIDWRQRINYRSQIFTAKIYMLMHRGWSHYVDQLRDDLWQHHPQIHIVDFDFYNMDVFNRCENTNDVLLAIPGWATVHPLLKVIPVEWNYSIPYGILHSPEPTPMVQLFLDAAKIISKELYS